MIRRIGLRTQLANDTPTTSASGSGVAIDVAAQGCAQHEIVGEVLSMVHVRFQRLVPGLHVRVVGHAAQPVAAAR
jgi:hypothetical protein